MEGLRKLMLLVMLLLPAAPAFSQNKSKIKTVKLAEYYAMLTAVTERIPYLGYGDGPDSLMSLLKRMPDTIRVTYTDEQGKPRTKEISNQWIKRTFEPNGGWTSADLNDTIRIAHNLLVRLGAYMDDLDESWGTQNGDSTARNKVKSILASKRFEKDKELEIERDRRFDRGVGGGMDFYKTAPWLLFALMFVGLIFLLIRLGNNVDMAITPEEVQVVAGKGLLKEGEPTESAAMKKLAKEAQAAGKLEAALRFHYLSFILLLHERRVISYRPSYTVWEYYSLLTDKKFPGQPVFDFSMAFDRSAYGKKTVTPADMEKFEGNLEEGISAMKRVRE